MNNIEKKMLISLKEREINSQYNTHEERIHDMVKYLFDKYNPCRDIDIINSIEKFYYDYIGISNEKLWKLIDNAVQELFEPEN